MKPLPENHYDIECDYDCGKDYKCPDVQTAVRKHPQVAALLQGKMIDKLGQEITVGSYIAYGHALGRCAGIRIGKVLKLDIKYDPYSHLPGLRITVQGVDDDWSHKKLALTAKKGTLMYPDRMIVLDPKVVPSQIKTLFGDECA